MTHFAPFYNLNNKTDLYFYFISSKKYKGIRYVLIF